MQYMLYVVRKRTTVYKFQGIDRRVWPAGLFFNMSLSVMCYSNLLIGTRIDISERDVGRPLVQHNLKTKQPSFSCPKFSSSGIAKFANPNDPANHVFFYKTPSA